MAASQQQSQPRYESFVELLNAPLPEDTYLYGDLDSQQQWPSSYSASHTAVRFDSGYSQAGGSLNVEDVTPTSNAPSPVYNTRARTRQAAAQETHPPASRKASVASASDSARRQDRNPRKPAIGRMAMCSTTSTKASPATESPSGDKRVRGSQGEKRQGGGRPQGSTNFSTADLDTLLKLVEKHMPYGMNGWKRVCDEYNEYALVNIRPKRDARALRQKYYRLVNSKKPTGDPDCPDEVRRAKRLEREIEERVHYGVINDDADDEVPGEWRDDDDEGPEDDTVEQPRDSEEGLSDPVMSNDSSEESETELPKPARKRARIEPELSESSSRRKSSVAQRHRQHARSLLQTLHEHFDPEACARREMDREAAAELYTQCLLSELRSVLELFEGVDVLISRETTVFHRKTCNADLCGGARIGVPKLIA
ncbi:hypothetical protein NUW54_g11718 [Trametes sanguinea]|uniref:Uncharacterized protein n=1 Tax=Trametes sanguinea TaxID=158606 RepID=A0ACC1NAP9_9APHY|nr:hypothetical protein NUW54_g11718 [Trametes sanguinea]